MCPAPDWMYAGSIPAPEPMSSECWIVVNQFQMNKRQRRWTKPDLLVDDHHGVYMMHLLVKGEKSHRGRIYHELEKNLNTFLLRAILQGPEHEEYWEACDRVTQLTFTRPSGQRFIIDYVNGGLWAIPHCFRGKAREDFYGS